MKETLTRKSELKSGYKWGFETDIKSEKISKGLNETPLAQIAS